MTDFVEVGKAKAAGIVAVLIGLTAIADLVCGFIYLAKGGPDGSGIWTGFGLALCAAFGLLTWWKKSKIAMVFFLVFDILWFVVCAAGVAFTLIVWIIYQIIIKVLEANCHMTDAGECHCTGEQDVPIKVDNCDDIRIIEQCLLGIIILNGIGAVLALAGSIIGCLGTCCAGPTHTNVVVVEQSGMTMQPTAQVAPSAPPDFSTTVGKH